MRHQVSLPPPGPSFVREETVRPRGREDNPLRLRAGMTRPSVTDDGWWLAHLWLADDEGIADCTSVAPLGGPPPGAPFDAVGPRMAGALAGLIAEEGGRQMLRLRMPPAPDESRPWQRPLLCMLAVKWDPVRAAVLRDNELARELLRGFAAALEGVGRPQQT
jgi:hypothetical protein